MRTLEQRERRLARARVISRIEIGLGTLAVALPPLLAFAAPTLSRPMFSRPAGVLESLPVLAYVALLLGYGWMLRIRFRGPEDGARSNWRSH